MPGPAASEVECCGADWAAAYANRVRQMMNTYRQDGAARVYWLTLPAPRDPDRQKIARVGQRRDRASPPSRGARQVRVLDTVPIFTPGGGYRDAMDVDGARDDRPRVRRHPPQRRRALACWPVDLLTLLGRDDVFAADMRSLDRELGSGA